MSSRIYLLNNSWKIEVYFLAVMAMKTPLKEFCAGQIENFLGTNLI